MVHFWESDVKYRQSREPSSRRPSSYRISSSRIGTWAPTGSRWWAQAQKLLLGGRPEIFGLFGNRKPVGNAKIEQWTLGTTWKPQAMRKMILVLTILHPIYHSFGSFKLLQFFWESQFRTCFKKLISSRRFLSWWWLLVEVFIDTFKKCTRSTVTMSMIQMSTTNDEFFRKSAYLEIST